MLQQIWIAKSRENLAVAEWCFLQRHHNACANRLYYAMFQAGFAVLLKYGIVPPKGKIGHGWLQANFSQQLIKKRKLFPAKFRSYLNDAQAVRNIADYEPFHVRNRVILREIKKTREFLQAIDKELS